MDRLDGNIECLQASIDAVRGAARTADCVVGQRVADGLAVIQVTAPSQITASSQTSYLGRWISWGTSNATGCDDAASRATACSRFLAEADAYNHRCVEELLPERAPDRYVNLDTELPSATVAKVARHHALIVELSQLLPKCPAFNSFEDRVLHQLNRFLPEEVPAADATETVAQLPANTKSRTERVIHVLKALNIAATQPYSDKADKLANLLLSYGLIHVEVAKVTALADDADALAALRDIVKPMLANADLAYDETAQKVEALLIDRRIGLAKFPSLKDDATQLRQRLGQMKPRTEVERNEYLLAAYRNCEIEELDKLFPGIQAEAQGVITKRIPAALATLIAKVQEDLADNEVPPSQVISEKLEELRLCLVNGDAPTDWKSVEGYVTLHLKAVSKILALAGFAHLETVGGLSCTTGVVTLAAGGAGARAKECEKDHDNCCQIHKVLWEVVKRTVSQALINGDSSMADYLEDDTDLDSTTYIEWLATEDYDLFMQVVAKGHRQLPDELRNTAVEIMLKKQDDEDDDGGKFEYMDPSADKDELIKIVLAYKEEEEEDLDMHLPLIRQLHDPMARCEAYLNYFKSGEVEDVSDLNVVLDGIDGCRTAATNRDIDFLLIDLLAQLKEDNEELDAITAAIVGRILARIVTSDAKSTAEKIFGKPKSE